LQQQWQMVHRVIVKYLTMAYDVNW